MIRFILKRQECSNCDPFPSSPSLSPGQTDATFQRNIVGHAVKELAKRTFSHLVAIRCSKLDGTNRTRAHDPAQQCCTNVAKGVQHHAASKNVARCCEKNLTISNLIQHQRCWTNRVVKSVQHVCAQQCCDMLR